MCEEMPYVRSKPVARWLLAFLAPDSSHSQGQNHLFLEHEPASRRFFEEIMLFLAGERA